MSQHSRKGGWELSFPQWKLQLSMCVWAAVPDFHGALVWFVYMVSPREQQHACSTHCVQLNGGVVL